MTVLKHSFCYVTLSLNLMFEIHLGEQKLIFRFRVSFSDFTGLVGWHSYKNWSSVSWVGTNVLIANLI